MRSRRLGHRPLWATLATAVLLGTLGASCNLLALHVELVGGSGGTSSGGGAAGGGGSAPCAGLDDHNDCTTDTCGADGTAAHAPRSAGATCTDGSGKTGTCDATGTCQFPCKGPGDCPHTNPCAKAACDEKAGVCVYTPVAEGTHTPGVQQVEGDCHVRTCVGGEDQDVVDDNDVPKVTSDCAVSICLHGTPSTGNLPLDTTCKTFAGKGDGFCDGNGACVECTKDSECTGPSTECEHPACEAFACTTWTAPTGTALMTQTPGDCHTSHCGDGGKITHDVDDGDLPVDGKECTADLCAQGVPTNPTLQAGTPCGNGAFACNAAGQCGCQGNADCTAPNTCGGGGTPQVCGCTPKTCSQLGATCGALPDGCFAALSCNTGVMDGGETDVDCGGPAATCPTRCANGKKCGAGSDCTSGFCVDGVCCDTACVGTCVACTQTKKGSGADGVCGTIAAGADPDAECASDPVTTCGRTGFCDGAGSCQRYAPGTTCGAASCSTAQYTQKLCNGQGTCATSTSSCSPYACNPSGPACRTSCSSDSHCASGYYCNGSGNCAAQMPPGGACSSQHECTSNACAPNGFCCAGGCTTGGVCGAVTCASSTGACSYPSSGTDCGTFCSGNTLTVRTCNGTGTCNNGTPTACAGNLACGTGSSCFASCQSDDSIGDARCVSGYHCDGASCVGNLAAGSQCSRATQCTSGSCSGGLCT